MGKDCKGKIIGTCYINWLSAASKVIFLDNVSGLQATDFLPKTITIKSHDFDANKSFKMHKPGA